MICPRALNVIRDAMILRENASEIMNTSANTSPRSPAPGSAGPGADPARAEGSATLEKLDAFVAAEPRLSWHRPEAGLIGLARRSTGIDGESLARRLLAPPYRTFLLPGSAYNLPRHIRLGAGGGPEARLEEGLERLSACFTNWEA